MTEKAIQLINSINSGKKLYEFKTVILRKNTVTYKLETKQIHPATVKTLIKEDYLMRGASIKTLGGWRTELLIKN